MDAANLSRQQKLDLIAALEEKRRREALRKPTYTPNKGQLEFHKSRARFRFNFSGNRFGKTTTLVNELQWILEGYNPITGESYPLGMRVAVVVDNTKKIERVVLPEWRKWHNLPADWLSRDGAPYTSRVSNERAEISFYSIEADPLLFEGTTLHAVYLDEPVPHHLYKALMRSLSLKEYPGHLTFCGTPIGQAWLRTEIYEKWTKNELPDTDIFKFSTDLNAANLGDTYIRDFSAALSEQEVRTRLHGDFFNSDAQALSHLWKRDVHVIKMADLLWKKEWPVVIGIDPHPVKKHVAVMVGATPSNHQIVLKELSAKLTAREYAAELIKWMEGYRVVDIVCDSLGSTEGTGNEGFSTFIAVLNEELRRAGKPGVRSTSYQEKSAEDAIDRLQTGLLIPKATDNYGLAIPKLRATELCRGVIGDIENVTWQKNRLTGDMVPKLNTASTDFLSALCYALAANVHFKRGEDRPTYMKASPYRGLTLKSERTPQPRIRQFVDDGDDW